jgi:hypothetical protein
MSDANLVKKTDDGFFNVTRLHRDDIKTQICMRRDIEEDALPEEISKRVDALTDIEMENLASKIEEIIMTDFWDVIDFWLDERDDIEDGIEKNKNDDEPSNDPDERRKQLKAEGMNNDDIEKEIKFEFEDE